jgi:hypothetical protein
MQVIDLSRFAIQLAPLRRDDTALPALQCDVVEISHSLYVRGILASRQLVFPCIAV